MKNRAKCKLCGDILESFHRHDFITCKCGEISIDGGSDMFKCGAKNWENFLRVDDEGNEIIVKLEPDPSDLKSENVEESKKLTRKEQIQMLESMLKNIENLPKHVMNLPINHYDFYTYLIIILSILKSSKKD